MGRLLTLNNDAERQIRQWFDALELVIPDAKPIGLRWTDNSCIEIPADEATDDDLIITPDMPDLDMLAGDCVSMVLDSQETFPGRHNWQRWDLTHKLSSFLYVSGITSSGGSSSMDGGDPVGGWVYSLPGWSSLWSRRRPYFLGKPDWWWQCHKNQGWKLRGRHKPLRPWAFGVCAGCVPCPSCGANYDCDDDCEMVAT